MIAETIINCGRSTSLRVTSSGNGPSTLLIHSPGRRRQDFLPLLQQLGHYSILAPDLRGHGLSTSGSGFSLSDHATDMNALIANSCRASEPWGAVGHSCGAAIALATYALRPANFRGLVLIDPVIGEPPASLKRTFESWHSTATKCADEPQVRDLARIVGEVDVAQKDALQVGDECAVRFTAATLHRVDPRALSPFLTGDWFAGCNLQSALKGVSCPVLLIAGETAQGALAGEKDLVKLRTLLPRAIEAKIPGAGHWPQWSHPVETGRLITQFLESL